jgi:hypothetical protein
MVEEPSHVKQLSLNHVCKIGLNQTVLYRTIQLYLREYFTRWSIAHLFVGEECYRKCDKRGHSHPGPGLVDRLPGHAAGGSHDHPGAVQLR